MRIGQRFYLVFALWTLTLGFSGLAEAVGHYDRYDADLPRLHQSSGSMKIYVWNSGAWQYQGNLAFDKFYREKQIKLGLERNPGDSLRVKLVKEGGGQCAH